MSVNMLRLRLFKIAGKVVRSGRKIQLKLSTHHVYRNLFYQLLAQIQALGYS
nr:transposase [Lentilactobacillus diolivorans]